MAEPLERRMLLSGASGQIFVANGGAIGEYTTSGATVNAALVSGLYYPAGIAVSGSDLFVLSGDGVTISEYTTSGATVNANLVPGLVDAYAIAICGSDLFVANAGGYPYDKGTIGEYTTSGATVNADLVSGLDSPAAIAVSGSDLFVANTNGSTIGEYTTSGATVNPALISVPSYPFGIAVSGSDLFVTSTNLSGLGLDVIGEYTTSGATVNATLISGLDYPLGIAVSGSDLFVVNHDNGTIGEYTTSGATVNAALVSGLDFPWGIAITNNLTTDVWTGAVSNDWNNSNNWSAGQSPASGWTVAINSGSVTASSPFSIGNLIMNGGTLQLASGSGTYSVSSLAINNAATLNVGNNELIVNFGSNPDPMAVIAGYVQNGFSGGTWTGTGITSSTVAAYNATDVDAYWVAVADGQDGNVAGLNAGQLEITAALSGDTNLDGTVDSTDLGILLANWQKTGMDWDQGGFDGSGTADSSDLGLLLANWQQTASPSVSSLGAMTLASSTTTLAGNVATTISPTPVNLSRNKKQIAVNFIPLDGETSGISPWNPPSALNAANAPMDVNKPAGGLLADNWRLFTGRHQSGR